VRYKLDKGKGFKDISEGIVRECLAGPVDCHSMSCDMSFVMHLDAGGKAVRPLKI
jgi:hypothetical protein